MTAKTVLITGSNRGIGLAFATHYKNEGWKVISCARNVDAATDVGPSILTTHTHPKKFLTLSVSIST